MPVPPFAFSVTFRFVAELPLVVFVEKKRWVIFHQHFPKGKAAIVASSGERRGYFAGGRPSQLEAAMSRGITVPAGTVRFELLRAMLDQGWVRIIRIDRLQTAESPASACGGIISG